MNDDLLNYDLDKEIERDTKKKNTSPPGGGNRLSTIFLVVLGLHVLVVIGISGFHLLRGQKAETDHATADLAKRPTIEEQAEAFMKPEMPLAESSTSAKVKLSTPSIKDPVWEISHPSQSVEPKVSTKVSSTLKTTKTAQDEPVRRAVPVKGPWSYEVVKGDTLSEIAKKTGVSVKEIKSTNGLKSDLIRIGQELQIPGEGQAPVSVTTHVVSKGETLYRIARRYNTTTAELAKLNDLSDPNRIKPGMELKVREHRANIQTKAAVEKSESNSLKPFRTPMEGTDLAMSLREGVSY